MYVLCAPEGADLCPFTNRISAYSTIVLYLIALALFGLSCLASELPGSTYLYQCWHYRHAQPYLATYMDYGDSNSDPHSCPPTEPSPQPTVLKSSELYPSTNAMRTEVAKECEVSEAGLQGLE